MEQKLTSHNYLDWKEVVRVYLRSIAQHRHLTDDRPSNDTRDAWIQNDDHLFYQTRNPVNVDVISVVNHYNNVKDQMEYLECLYTRKEDLSRIYDACRNFYNTKSNGMSLQAFFIKYTQFQEELNTLLRGIFYVRTQYAQQEQMIIMSFLAKLDPKYDARKCHILASTKISSL